MVMALVNQVLVTVLVSELDIFYGVFWLFEVLGFNDGFQRLGEFHCSKLQRLIIRVS